MIDFNLVKEKLNTLKPIDNTKYEDQIKWYTAWKKGNRDKKIKHANSSIIAVTGTGKSMIGVFALIENDNKNRTACVVVPTKTLQKEWLFWVEFFNLKNVDVLIINTASKLKNKNYDLKILDEIHLYLKGDVFKKVFQVKSTYNLGLTATLPDDDEVLYYMTLICPPLINVNWSEVLKKHYVADFRVTVLELPLPKRDCLQLDKWKRETSYYNSIIHGYGNLHKLIKNKDERIKFLKTYSSNIDEKTFLGILYGYQKTVSLRKQMMYDHKLKQDYVVKVCEKYDTQTLVFAQSKSAIEQIKKRLNEKFYRADIYHSGLRKSLLEKLLSDFEDLNKDLQILLSVNMLNQGINIANIGLSLITSFTNSPQTMTQRIGRSLRVSKDKDFAEIIIFCLIREDGIETKDETWLKNSLKNIPKEKITYKTWKTL